MVAVFNQVVRRTSGNRDTIVVLIFATAVSIPWSWSSLKRLAIPAAVVDAGVGTGSNSWPATSARRRSKPTRKSSPASWAEAIEINNCPPDRPRARSLTAPIPTSNTAVMPNTGSVSRSASTPAAGVNRPSGAPICTRHARTRVFHALMLWPRFWPRIVTTEQVPLPGWKMLVC